MRTITNDYRDAQILNLGSTGERGPYLVTQTGMSPKDPIPKTHMFVLRPDGNWVDLNVYASQRKPEAMDEIVFSTTTQIMQTSGKLFGQPRVLDLPIALSSSADSVKFGRQQLEQEQSDMFTILRLTGENLAAKVQLTQVRASRLRERVNLYLALGGDFAGSGSPK